jgi:hypothetical protein
MYYKTPSVNILKVFMLKIKFIQRQFNSISILIIYGDEAITYVSLQIIESKRDTSLASVSTAYFRRMSENNSPKCRIQDGSGAAEVNILLMVLEIKLARTFKKVYK